MIMNVFLGFLNLTWTFDAILFCLMDLGAPLSLEHFRFMIEQLLLFPFMFS